MASQVKEPCLFINTFSDLGKDRKVLRLQIMTVIRASEIEAVILHVAFCVFATEGFRSMGAFTSIDL